MTLRQLREAHGLTQTEFAAAVGVTSQAVYEWERGKYTPSLANARAIAQKLGVTVQEVLDAIDATKAEANN